MGQIRGDSGSTIMAFSVSNVHYSRLALNNIVTQFFWATCFFFLLRALRSRRPSDWALAGLSAGLSEYFYYGTRLLPFILAMFMVFLLAVHWKHARQYAGGFLLLAGSYFVGFGPLLIHFIRNPKPLPGPGSKPPDLVTAHSDQFRRFPPGLENDLASVVRELAWNQHSHFTRHHILWTPIVTCRKRAPGPGRCAAFVALASSGRVSHTRLGARCLPRGRNARGVSEQRATSDQSLDSCLPGLLCCVGSACPRMDNGGTIRVGTPVALNLAGNGRSCITRAWLLQSAFLFPSLLRRP